MDRLLKDIAKIKVGYYAQETESIGIPYLQARQFDEYGNLVSEADTFLSPVSKVTTQLLKDGDVLFASKGNRNFAWCYRQSVGDAVASGIFFVITPDTSLVLPEYLAVIFNHPVCQNYFAQLGSGSNIKSIRKSELEDLQVPLVSLEIQKKIVAIHNLHLQAIAIAQNLTRQKTALYENVINSIINTK